MLGVRFLTVWGAVGDASDVLRDTSEALGNTDVRVFGFGREWMQIMRFCWRCENDLGGRFSGTFFGLLGVLGETWEALGDTLEALGDTLEALGDALGALGHIWWLLWDVLVSVRRLVGSLWRFMDALWGPCGGSWGHFGGSWGRSWRTLGALGHALVASRDTGGTFQIMFGRSV